MTGDDATESGRARKQAEETEAQLRGLLDTIPQIVWTADTSGKALYYNQKWWEYTGFDPRTYRHVDALDAVHPEDRAALLEHWSRCTAQETPIEYQYRLRAADGSYRWHLGRIVPVRDASGRIYRWVGTATEIEAQKQSEIEYRTLSESVPNFVWRTDLQGRMDFANSRFTEYTGLTMAELNERGWPSVIHPDDLAQLGESWLLAKRNGSAYEGKFRLKSKDGDYRWMIRHALPLRDVSGKITSWVGTTTDIHDLYAAKRSVIEAEQRFRAVFAQSSLPMQLYAVDGTPIDVNVAWETLFDSRRDQLKGYNILIDPQQAANGVTPYLHRAIAGEAVDVPVSYYDPEKIGRRGRPRWLEATFFPVKDGEGAVRELAIVIRDVTAREVAEKKLKESNEQLEQAAQARQDLLNICGHELKTPLSSLRLQTQTAKRRIARGDPSVYEPEKVRKLVNSYESQIDRLVHLVDDMLDLTRISSGKLALTPEPVAFSRLVLEVLDRLSDQLALAGCTISTSLPPNVIGLWDRFRIEQVVVNLLTNALRYGKGAPITVSVMQTDGMGILTVQDQGIGIAKEHHERIFQRFERAISATEISGLGLGLFIVREIVKAHGGTIRVMSEPGSGATFFVELPLQPEVGPG